MIPTKTISKKHKQGYLILFILGIMSIVGMLLMPPINQDVTYHNFSDTNAILRVSNFWNVVSNLPFLAIGFWGLLRLKTMSKTNLQYNLFFIGVILIALGSSFYHLNPNNASLVWDRLPMTIVFMSLVSIIISECISDELGRRLLIPLLFIGVLSVMYWVVYDDLRVYSLVQFYPMLGIPIVLCFFKSKYTMTYAYWLLLLAYIVAKVCEYYDREIFELLTVISGHSLKHMVSSIGLIILVYSYSSRESRVVKD